MAQATYVPNIAHSDAEALAFFNSVFEAIATNNSGPTAPSETFPGMFWLDTSTTPPTLRQRNQANSNWIDLIPPPPPPPIGSVYDYQEFLASGNWVKPMNSLPTDIVGIHLVGGGGSGGVITNAGARGGGGGGGLYYEFFASQLGASVPVVIGAGGASVRGTAVDGNPGGLTRFGAVNTELTLTAPGGNLGTITPPAAPPSQIYLAGGQRSLFYANANRGESSEYGAGGGGSAVNFFGTSIFAGDGGLTRSNTNAEAGKFPGGGGGGVTAASGNRTSGEGADGIARVWVRRGNVL